LVIEVDGGQHFEASQARRDERRTAYLEAQNLRVLRFTDREVLQQLDFVVDAVFAPVSAAGKSPWPASSKGEAEAVACECQCSA
jgi:very-short-patch-repair endonuclease